MKRGYLDTNHMLDCQSFLQVVLHSLRFGRVLPKLFPSLRTGQDSRIPIDELIILCGEVGGSPMCFDSHKSDSTYAE
jgi:hypothetical protein